ncbi:MAG: DUF4145 domain-containing protein [Chitinophagaceae bacterium]|nr:MAG: DUF4145 domain-containing protein [Chitinophagaceae bacterium]
MEVLSQQEFKDYIKNNYPPIFQNGNVDLLQDWPGYCGNQSCNRDVFFRIESKALKLALFQDTYPGFGNVVVTCPVCKKKFFILAAIIAEALGAPGAKRYIYYELFRMPFHEDSFEIEEIPREYTSLRGTAAEAKYCLLHSKNIAAAIMFRRGIQILAKDVLGAPGGRTNLYKQLEWLKTNPNNLGIDLVDVFHENAQIIKDVGNQGAHPDDDESLHSFTKEDAEAMHDLFISIVYEVFIKPARLKALQEELRTSRKLNSGN